MAIPSLQIGRRTAPSDMSGGVRVTLGDLMRAHRATEAFLWEQRSVASCHSPLPPPMPALRRDSGARVLPASALANEIDATRAGREPASEERAQLKADGWVFADEAGSLPKAKQKVTRYLPPEPRFVSWIEARGGTATLSAIARRFNLTAAEVDVLLSRFGAAGLVVYHEGRGGGRRFVLRRTPRSPTMQAL